MVIPSASSCLKVLSAIIEKSKLKLEDIIVAESSTILLDAILNNLLVDYLLRELFCLMSLRYVRSISGSKGYRSPGFALVMH